MPSRIRVRALPAGQALAHRAKHLGRSGFDPTREAVRRAQATHAGYLGVKT